jgi:hypothetical protein
MTTKNRRHTHRGKPGARRTKPEPRRKVVFDHDPEPDFSWLEQDHYKPGHKDYSPIYRTDEDMKAKRNAIPDDWYTDPDNHVALMMTVFELADDDDDWRVVDSLGSIDFLADSNDWQTGTFYTLAQLSTSPYLQELAKEAGLK